MPTGFDMARHRAILSAAQSLRSLASSNERRVLIQEYDLIRRHWRSSSWSDPLPDPICARMKILEEKLWPSTE